MREKYGLTGNALKIIAAISMFIDHMGLIFFPGVELFRILGRIALPIFAFMIAEGCKYTKNRLRYFLSVFLLAALCQIVYFIYDGDTYMSILVTFSISILVIYLMQMAKEALSDNDVKLITKIFFVVLFVLSVILVYILNQYIEIDYGFYGCMLPVFASAFHKTRKNATKFFEKFDCIYIHILILCVGMLLLALNSDTRQFWSFAAIPFLFLYSGKRGKANMKYFFYIFYPLHLVFLEFLGMIV